MKRMQVLWKTLNRLLLTSHTTSWTTTTCTEFSSKKKWRHSTPPCPRDWTTTIHSNTSEEKSSSSSTNTEEERRQQTTAGKAVKNWERVRGRGGAPHGFSDFPRHKNTLSAVCVLQREAERWCWNKLLWMNIFFCSSPLYGYNFDYLSEFEDDFSVYTKSSGPNMWNDFRQKIKCWSRRCGKHAAQNSNSTQ